MLLIDCIFGSLHLFCLFHVVYTICQSLLVFACFQVAARSLQKFNFTMWPRQKWRRHFALLLFVCIFGSLYWKMSIIIPWMNMKTHQVYQIVIEDARYFFPPPPSPTPYVPIIRSTNYTDALREVASDDNVVVLALVDQGFVSMAVNFYLTCLKPHAIENYLILTMHPDTCRELYTYRVKCFQYLDEIKGNNKSSNFGSKQFIQKMNVRTDMIIDALKVGISVLHTDIDVTYIKNPLEHIHCNKTFCDLAILADGPVYNAGFLMVHPAALPVYRRMKHLSVLQPLMNDQEQLNKAVAEQRQKLKVIKLPISQFLCGKFYYQDAKRFYADTMKPCPDCVVVHNNWIVSLEAKIYRAKEVHQWMNDDNKYYSSSSRKYMTYSNGPKPYHIDNEKAALKSGLAISQVLNRTLVLPKFYCDHQAECPLNSFLKVRFFDKSFAGVYREHSFLTHKLVPESVKSSVLSINQTIDFFDETYISGRFLRAKESVLKFQYLNFNVTFHNATVQKHFNDLITQGFVKGTYKNV